MKSRVKSAADEVRWRRLEQAEIVLKAIFAEAKRQQAVRDQPLHEGAERYPLSKMAVYVLERKKEWDRFLTESRGVGLDDVVGTKNMTQLRQFEDD